MKRLQLLASRFVVIFGLGSILCCDVGWSQTFSTIDFPGGRLTVPVAINDLGEIVGEYEDASGVEHAFSYSAGVFTSFDAPFAGASLTAASGVNNSGQITGAYHTSFSNISGFLDTGGAFTEVAYPGAVQSGPQAINNLGEMVGAYADVACCTQFGFIYSGGVYSPLDIPPVYTSSAYGINDSDEIVGWFTADNDPTYRQQGFLEDGGAFTPINFPGSVATVASGINNGGTIVGYWYGSSQIYHGFLETDGTLSQLDYPGAVQTLARGINSNGDIVGYYVDSSGTSHGFLRKAITGISAPDVVGELSSAAESAIDAAGLTYTLSYADSATVASGDVISQNPPGGSLVDPGSSVALTISTGPPAVIFQVAAPTITAGSPAGMYTVSISLTNTGNVTVDSLTVSGMKLGGIAGSPTTPTTVFDVAVGASATFTAQFTGVAGTSAPLSAAGTYTDGAQQGSWNFSQRSLHLP